MKHLNRWVYAAVSVITLLLAGLVYAWSVLSIPIAEEFTQYSNAQLSLTFTISMSFFCLGGLVGGILLGKWQARYNVWIAGVLFCAGFLMASGMSSLAQLYIGYGVLGGFASGMAYNAIMGTVMKWFPDRQGQVSGILLMGFGISAFIIGKVYTAMLPGEVGGWRSIFRIMAFVLLAVMAVGGLFCVKPEAEDLKKYSAGAGRKQAAKTGGVEMNAGQMLRTSSFWIYVCWTILLSMTGLAFISQSSGIIREIAPDTAAGTVATVAGLLSIFNGVGRLILGNLFDKIGYKKNMLLDCCLFVIALGITIVSLLTKNFTVLVISFILFGIAYGGVTPMNSAIISSFYGLKHYPVNFSVINMTLLISSFGSTIAGMLYDKSQSFFTVFIVMIVAAVAGAVMVLLLKRPEER